MVTNEEILAILRHPPSPILGRLGGTSRKISIP